MVNNFSYFKLSNINTIKYPLVTDKSTRLLLFNQYSFIVHPKSNKTEIKAALEHLYNIKILKINTCHLPKKKKRITQHFGYKPKYKKAIIRLLAGNKINLFE